MGLAVGQQVKIIAKPAVDPLFAERYPKEVDAALARQRDNFASKTYQVTETYIDMDDGIEKFCIVEVGAVPDPVFGIATGLVFPESDLQAVVN